MEFPSLEKNAMVTKVRWTMSASREQRELRSSDGVDERVSMGGRSWEL